MKNIRYILFVCFLPFFMGCGDSTPEGYSISDDGLVYKFHEQNPGPKPGLGAQVTYHFSMRNEDNTLLTSSRLSGNPVKTIIPNRVRGSVMLRGVQMMSKGDSLTLRVSVDSLPRIPDGQNIKNYVFVDLKLLDFLPFDEFMKQQQRQDSIRRIKVVEIQKFGEEQKEILGERVKQYASGKLATQTAPSGLKYIIHKPGEGKPVVQQEPVFTHYIGMLKDGTVFDESFIKAKALEFRPGLGEVIKGWDEGIQFLKEGGEATLFIPAELGYGASGFGDKIPPNSEIIFFVQVAKVGH